MDLGVASASRTSLSVSNAHAMMCLPRPQPQVASFEGGLQQAFGCLQHSAGMLDCELNVVQGLFGS